MHKNVTLCITVRWIEFLELIRAGPGDFFKSLGEVPITNLETLVKSGHSSRATIYPEFFEKFRKTPDNLEC